MYCDLPIVFVLFSTALFVQRMNPEYFTTSEASVDMWFPAFRYRVYRSHTYILSTHGQNIPCSKSLQWRFSTTHKHAALSRIIFEYSLLSALWRTTTLDQGQSCAFVAQILFRLILRRFFVTMKNRRRRSYSRRT